MESLALGSVGESTQKNFLEKLNIWVKERRAQGKGSWLHTLADPDQVLGEVLEFMTCRCFMHNNQYSTVRGYLAAIKHFHKMYAGCELPTSHYMIAELGEGIDRAHGMTPKRAPARLPLTWSILLHGQREETSMVDGGCVMWPGLALS